MLVTTTDGTWVGLGADDLHVPVAALQRRRRASCANIVGAAEPDLPRHRPPTSASPCASIVTATNGAGSATQASLVTGIVGTNPPANDVAARRSRSAATAIAVDGAVAAHRRSARGPALVPDDHDLPVVALRRRRRELRHDPRRDRLELPAHARSDVGLTSARTSSRRTPAARRRADRADRRGRRAPRRATSRRRAITGGAAVGRTLTAEPGVWIGHARAALRLPVAALRRRRRRLPPTSPARRRRPTSSGPRTTALSLRVVVTASNDVGERRPRCRSSTGEVQTSRRSTIDAPDDPRRPSCSPRARSSRPTRRLGRRAAGRPTPTSGGAATPRCTGCVDIAGATGSRVRADQGRRRQARARRASPPTNVVGVTTPQTDRDRRRAARAAVEPTAPTIVTDRDAARRRRSSPSTRRRGRARRR